MRMSYDAYMYYSHLNKLVNINMYFTAYIIYIITHIYIHILKSWANLPSWMIQIVGCRKVWLTSPGSTRPQLSSWVSQPALVILADRAVEFHLGWRQDWFRIVYACRRGKKTHGVELCWTDKHIMTYWQMHEQTATLTIFKGEMIVQQKRGTYSYHLLPTTPTNRVTYRIILIHQQTSEYHLCNLKDLGTLQYPPVIKHG